MEDKAKSIAAVKQEMLEKMKQAKVQGGVAKSLVIAGCCIQGCEGCHSIADIRF